jgi:dipeptidyl aminopeptidase/acylaminoacyl peptidase
MVRDVTAAWLGIALLILSPIGTHAVERHAVALSDLLSLVDVDDLHLSPDGAYLAYTVHPLAATARHAIEASEVWMLATRPGSAPVKAGSGMLPVWSPDGRRFAYYSGRTGNYQLWVFDRTSGVSTQMTRIPDGIDPDPYTRMVGWYYEPLLFSWSPDGTRLVFASRVTGAAIGASEAAVVPASTSDPRVLTRSTPAEWALAGVFTHPLTDHAMAAGWETHGKSEERLGKHEAPRSRINQLFVAEVATGSVRQLTTDGGGYFNPQWSPTGKSIVAASTEGEVLSDANFGTVPTNIVVVDVESGRSTALTQGAGDRRRPAWSPDARRIAYLQGGFAGTQAIYQIHVRGGGEPNRVATTAANIENFQWLADGRSILIVDEAGLSRMELSSGHLTRVAKALGAGTPMTASARGAIAWKTTLEHEEQGREVIQLLARGATSAVTLSELNPQMTSLALGDQEIIHWPSSGGDEREGVLIKPVGHQAGRQYPLIVDCYPGRGTGPRLHPMFQNQAWASEGYMTLNPTRTRAPHIGSWTKPYAKPAFGKQGWDITADDILSGVDELIRRGLVDPDRMCLYGFSNGGGIVDYLVTQTHRFKCAVSVAAVMPDWISPVLLESKSFPMLASGTTPWEDPDSYVKLSAVFRLQNVTTPMLLAVGDNDGDFLLGMIEMYNGLRWAGKDVTLLRYPNQGHGFAGAALEDFWTRESTFLATYLAPTSTLSRPLP